jgi:hypothetical protein
VAFEEVPLPRLEGFFFTFFLLESDDDDMMMMNRVIYGV